MALVTTASVDSGEITTYTALPSPLGAATPIGEQNFAGSQVIAAVGATDTATWTLQLNLARNFAHRIVDLEVLTTGSTAGNIAEWLSAMFGTVSIDKNGQSSVLTDFFELKGQNYFVTTDVFHVAFAFLASGDHSSARFFHPVNLPGRIYDCMDAGRIFTRWFNSTGDTTSVDVFWRAKTLVYDITQLNQSALTTYRATLSP